MDRIPVILAALLAFLVLPACQQLPESKEAAAGTSIQTRALGSPYGAAIVKDLDPAHFEAIRPELARVFGASFRETLQRHGYVRQALAEGSEADVVVIQPVAMRVAVQGGALMELEIAVATRDARGRFLGWHAVRYIGEPQDTLPVSRDDALRRAFADAGEQVARAIATAR